ncbi:maleylpyruvate isomerase family mycothiol-dependent enzyme [Streptomyces sp. NBC_01546]|uniref:maleylpyruvate isomerase family mycothiol-dependent enzyme n=1 Tax=Streptomyces sp. NBC_01546 TaxID=2975872 RepID=UPI003866609B
MKSLPPTPETFALIADAGNRLLRDLDRLTDADAAAPSRLDGWSRAHVLSHLSAQVDALERLLHWARTGTETSQYADRSARDTEIEDGSRQPAAALVERVRGSADRFLTTVRELPDPAWQAVVRPFTGELCTPGRILVIRLRELEVHHTDLGLGYGFGDIPRPAVDVLLDDVSGYLAAADGTPPCTLRDDTGARVTAFGSGGPVVTGPRGALLAWLTGRSTGEGLTAPGGALPRLPAWI